MKKLYYLAFLVFFSSILAKGQIGIHYDVQPLHDFCQYGEIGYVLAWSQTYQDCNFVGKFRRSKDDDEWVLKEKFLVGKLNFSHTMNIVPIEIKTPFGIIPPGSVLISDTNNHRVVIMNPDGEICWDTKWLFLEINYPNDAEVNLYDEQPKLVVLGSLPKQPRGIIVCNFNGQVIKNLVIEKSKLLHDVDVYQDGCSYIYSDDKEGGIVFLDWNWKLMGKYVLPRTQGARDCTRNGGIYFSANSTDSIYIANESTLFSWSVQDSSFLPTHNFPVPNNNPGLYNVKSDEEGIVFCFATKIFKVSLDGKKLWEISIPMYWPWADEGFYNDLVRYKYITQPSLSVKDQNFLKLIGYIE